MKRVLLMVIVVLLITGGSVFGAGKQEATEVPVDGEGSIRIGVILKTLANAHWVSMEKGFKDQAAKMGVEIDIYAVSTEGDIEAQLRLFESALEKGYDGFSVSPITGLNLVTGIVKANKKGIPVINVDEAVDLAALEGANGKIAAFIRTDNYSIGQKAAEFVASKLDGGQVAIIEGMAGNSSGTARRDGFKDGIAQLSGFEVVASQPADWDRIKALDVSTNMMNRFPDLKAIYCCNDTMALGVVQAAKNNGKLGNILVIGTDGIDEAINSVETGEMDATIAQDPYNMGTAAVIKLVELIESGKDQAEDFDMLVPSKLITK